MDLLKVSALAGLLISGAGNALPLCDNFQIKLKNNLSEDLLISKIKLSGAELQSNDFETLKADSEQIFTVNHSSDELPMLGEFTLHTVSLSSKKVEIKYTIESKGTFCIHTDFSPEGEYGVEKIRGVGEVLYSITN